MILSEEMKKPQEVQLFEEEETWSHPPILALYGLDGNLYTYFMYHSLY